MHQHLRMGGHARGQAVKFGHQGDVLGGIHTADIAQVAVSEVLRFPAQGGLIKAAVAEPGASGHGGGAELLPVTEGCEHAAAELQLLLRAIGTAAHAVEMQAATQIFHDHLTCRVVASVDAGDPQSRFAQSLRDFQEAVVVEVSGRREKYDETLGSDADAPVAAP